MITFIKGTPPADPTTFANERVVLFADIAETLRGPQGATGAAGAQGPAGLPGSDDLRVANVVNFGADLTGVADSYPAFLAAMNSFGPSGDERGGIIWVPFGRYRFATGLGLKKGVWVLGSQGAGTNNSCVLVGDPGVTPITFERYNTPIGTTDGGAGDGAQISNLKVTQSAKVADWQTGQVVTAGTRRRTGTGIKEDWRRHYICTTGGITAASGNGPRSLGHDKILNYKNQTVNFTRGQYVLGGNSGASGIVITDTDSGALGQLRLTSVFGTFQDNETLIDQLGGSALVSGTMSDPVDDEHDGTAKWSYLGSGAGIKIRANGCTVREVTVIGVSGCGIHIEAQDIECPNQQVNANGWRLINVAVWQSDGHGLFVNGSDANGSGCIHGTFYSNGGPGANGDPGDEDFTGTGFNVYDSSFLGNEYFDLQMGSGGQGSLYSDAIGGGSTFTGCYQEGTGGGENVCKNTCVIVGGSLAASIFSADSAPVILGPPNQSRGIGHRVAGYGSAPWRANIHTKLGNQRQHNGNVYEVITPGVTGNVGPSGTGADIVDGTTHWAFIHATTYDGAFSLGSADPRYENFWTAIGREDVTLGDYLYFVFRDSPNGLTLAYAHQYGISGPNPAEGYNGAGLCHASRASVLDDGVVKTKIPAGKPVTDEIWIGGCRYTSSASAADPTSKTWNSGDVILYHGAARTAGKRGRSCLTGGTAGTYTGGRTATADGSTVVVISGAAMSGIVDQHDFKVGDKLTINGVTSLVRASSEDGRTLTMGSSIGAGSGLAITFSHPVFEEF